MISDEIRAKVDEAEAEWSDQDFYPTPWRMVNGQATAWNGRVIHEVGGVDGDLADLIVSVVNRERAQIEHARDVMERHWPAPSALPWASACWGCLADWPCPEILSLARAWGVQA